jgi:hypothetical protein
MKVEFTKQSLVLGTILLASILCLMFLGSQSDFKVVIVGYISAFITYALIWRTATSKDLSFYLLLALLVRFSLIFAFPQLSDDIYRFIWDGRLITHGHNPFNYLPNQIMEEGWAKPWLNAELFELLNSREYFTIYPPVAQFTFATSAWLFPDSLFGSAVVMKLFLFVFEAGTLFLLPKLLQALKMPKKNVLIYALNPLVIVEVMGNLHFEGAMVFFLILAVYFLVENKEIWSAVSMALAIAAKLLPLLFLMFFIKRLGRGRAIRYFAVIGIVLVILFLPLLNEVFFYNFGQSLDLYFQKFEFNASVYYLARKVGYLISGYNLILYIGPILASLTFIGILVAAIKERDIAGQKLIGMMLFAICLYLAFTPTVHPWYVIMPLALSVFTRFRFVMLWSGLITLTYINYSYTPYFENLWIVALEYMLVYALLIVELIRPQLLSRKL